MEVVDNRALLLRVRNPAQIVQAIPKSRQLSNSKVLVNWGLEEAQVLKNLRIKDVPSPIKGRYKWPGQYKPLQHQVETAAFLTMHRRAFCFNEQGTGKTASVIWAADFLMKIGQVHRVLIVCPLSIMDAAWGADLFKVAMHRSVATAYGSKEARRKVIAGNYEFVIINYDGIEVVLDELEAGGFDLIVVDEATALKNVSTKRWKLFNHLLKATNARLWMLTGTPAAQSPLDAYGLAKLVSPSNVPAYFGSFRDTVMTKVTQFKWVPKPDAAQVVFDALQPAIRFTKDECLDLPERIYVQRKVDLTPQQKKYYDLLKTQMLMTAGGEQVTAVNAAVVITKLLQVSCGAVYSDGGDVIEFDISNRYKVLCEAIEESSQKVLVFAPYKNIINLLAERLTKDGYPTGVVHGDVKVGDRTRLFNSFQTESSPRVLVIQPQAAAHGVTLTAANTVVWWGPIPALEYYAQANDRVHRTGQHHPCTVVQLIGSPAEQRVYKMLDEKIDVHSQMLGLYKDLSGV